MDFTISTFTEYGPHCANFDQLLAQAIRSKSGLEIDFEACAIRIAPNAEESTMLFAAPQLDLDACSRSRGASALLPFLETASSVYLSHTDLYFLRLHRRTIADCLARNLFNAFRLFGSIFTGSNLFRTKLRIQKVKWRTGEAILVVFAQHF